MNVTLAMHQASLAHIGDRLDALGLDAQIVTFDDAGQFSGLSSINSVTVSAENVEADYVWLSAHLPSRNAAFQTVLAMKRVGVLQTFNAGLDDPFYRAAANKGITICNSSAQGVAIAEYVLGQVMAVFQPFAQQRKQQNAREWKLTRYREISRTSWLIIGYGPIGQAVAHRVKAFGADVAVVRRSPGAGPEVDRVGTLSDLPDLLGRADVVVLACPLNDQTHGMANTAFFDAIKPGAVLVNVARGPLIDDGALIAALDSGAVETAILDVFHTEPLPADDPLWAHPGVRLTPHTSFAGDGVQGRWDQLFLDNFARFVWGEPLEQVVDPADL